jgi:hypothetical protein
VNIDLLPCPFCGGSNLDVEHTHTAAYWVLCECGAEVHGKAFGTSRMEPTDRDHREALKSACVKWNTRRPG